MNNFKLGNQLDYRRYLSQIPKPVREKSKSFAPTIAAIALIIFFLLTAVRPTVIEITGLMAEIKARRELNDKLEKKIQQIVTAQQNYTQIYDRLYLLNQSLPGDPQFASLAKRVEAERVDQQLGLTGLNYNTITLTGDTLKTKKEQRDSFTFSTEMSGNYPEIKSFLSQLFHHRRPIYVEDLEISLVNQKEEETAVEKPLDISLTGQVFYYSHGQ